MFNQNVLTGQKDNIRYMSEEELNSAIDAKFLEFGIEVVRVDSPVFEIVQDADTKRWSILDAKTTEERIAILECSSKLKVVNARTISLDGGRVRNKTANYLYQTDEELIQEWVNGIRDRVNAKVPMSSSETTPLFMRAYPKVEEIQLKVVDGISFETARMTKGMDEPTFTRREVKDCLLSVVFGRVYFEGIDNESQISLASEGL